MKTKPTQPPAELAAPPCCAFCSDPLQGADLDYPYHDSDGDAYCERCYCAEIEGQCDRCGEFVEKEKELAMRPGELVALWRKVGGLSAGYYRVLRWPIYADGMISGHIYEDHLKLVSPLDLKGEDAAESSDYPGGCLCKACRDDIDKHNGRGERPGPQDT